MLKYSCTVTIFFAHWYFRLKEKDYVGLQSFVVFYFWGCMGVCNMLVAFLTIIFSANIIIIFFPIFDRKEKKKTVSEEQEGISRQEQLKRMFSK